MFSIVQEELAAAITMEANNKRQKNAHLRCLSVLSSRQGLGIGSQLLRKAEAMCRGHGCLSVKIDISMQRNNIIEWLKKNGYKNLAGGAWMHDGVVDVTQYLTMVKDLTKPEPTTPIVTSKEQIKEQAEQVPNLPQIDPNMSEILELTQAFAKSLDGNADSMEVEFTNSETLSSSGMDTTSTSTSTSTSSSVGLTLTLGDDFEGGHSDNLEDLLGSLMSQLKTPSGKQQFDDLVAAEERNILGVQLDADGNPISSGISN
mmetsp:Transcript_16450/g.19460  ORF Transcript_16450/g.19460 Transcript_16450/m.19460 type:complete len:259 (-) Transcript_16450:85-861(-)